jgi:hypothetical protein
MISLINYYYYYKIHKIIMKIVLLCIMRFVEHSKVPLKITYLKFISFSKKCQRHEAEIIIFRRKVEKINISTHSLQNL